MFKFKVGDLVTDQDDDYIATIMECSSTKYEEVSYCIRFGWPIDSSF